MMSTADLLTLLAQPSPVPGTWQITENTRIRFCVADTHYRWDKPITYCPITYTALLKLDYGYGMAQWDLAAEKIGLALNEASDVVSAADHLHDNLTDLGKLRDSILR